MIYDKGFPNNSFDFDRISANELRYDNKVIMYR